MLFPKPSSLLKARNVRLIVILTLFFYTIYLLYDVIGIRIGQWQRESSLIPLHLANDTAQLSQAQPLVAVVDSTRPSSAEEIVMANLLAKDPIEMMRQRTKEIEEAEAENARYDRERKAKDEKEEKEASEKKEGKEKDEKISEIEKDKGTMESKTEEAKGDEKKKEKEDDVIKSAIGEDNNKQEGGEKSEAASDSENSELEASKRKEDGGTDTTKQSSDTKDPEIENVNDTKDTGSISSDRQSLLKDGKEISEDQNPSQDEKSSAGETKDADGDSNGKSKTATQVAADEKVKASSKEKESARKEGNENHSGKNESHDKKIPEDIKATNGNKMSESKGNINSNKKAGSMKADKKTKTQEKEASSDKNQSNFQEEDDDSKDEESNTKHIHSDNKEVKEHDALSENSADTMSKPDLSSKQKENKDGNGDKKNGEEAAKTAASKSEAKEDKEDGEGKGEKDVEKSEGSNENTRTHQDLEPTDDNYLALCLAVGNQAKDLPEFFVHHYHHHNIRNFYIMDDRSDPPMKDFVDTFKIPAEAITFVYNTEKRDLGQQLLYDECNDQFGQKHSWLGFFDVDEFLEVKDADETIQSILHGLPDTAGSLGVQWIMHTSNGLLERPVSARKAFTECVADDLKMEKPSPDDNDHVKSIVRTSAYVTSQSPHHAEHPEGFFQVGEDGQPFSGPWRRPPTRDKVALHHYCVKSRGEYEEKMQRGNGQHQPKQMDFWEHIHGLSSMTCEEMVKYDP